MKLEGKVAVITGAASGIGKEIAKLYAKEGASVVISDLNVKGALEVVEKIENENGKAIAVAANVTKQADVDYMIDLVVNTYGKLDMLVNNAGIMDELKHAAVINKELWDNIFAINTTSMMRSTRKALSDFLEAESGVIINMASAAALHGSRAGVAYTAAKHAVVGLTKNVGFQYATKGIRCNAIAPGGVNTEIAGGESNEFGMDRVMSGATNNPRSGEPIEVAKVALFLASDDSSFVNGEVIKADAGWMAY